MQTFRFSLLLVIYVCLLGCQREKPCSIPRRITADPQCVTGNGLKLALSGYDGVPLSFTWNIIALKDSSNVFGWTPKDLKIRYTAPQTFTLPDSIPNNYRRIIVFIEANCDGKLLQSTSFGFIKTKRAGSSCANWTSQMP
jgi:hypothetical protein